jgi:hypothetical protein
MFASSQSRCAHVKRGNCIPLEPVQIIVELVEPLDSVTIAAPAESPIKEIKNDIQALKLSTETQVSDSLKETQVSDSLTETQVSDSLTETQVSDSLTETQVSEIQPIAVENTITTKTSKKTKTKIPLSLRIKVWNTNIGIDIGRTRCACCDVNEITQFQFECGHIISEASGGPTSLDNLLPICSSCNRSMHTMNLYEFKRKHFVETMEA